MKRKTAPDSATSSSSKDCFVRSFEHVDGNWPSHVYLEASACINHFTDSSNTNSDIVRIEEPHLSVSRPFVLRLHQIRPFSNKLAEALQHIQIISCRVESKYQMLCNDNLTREFLAIPVQDPNNKLLSITHIVDEVLHAFNQPKYYMNPVFHISVASRRLPSPCVGALVAEPPIKHIQIVDVRPSDTIGTLTYSKTGEDRDRDSDDCNEDSDDGNTWCLTSAGAAGTVPSICGVPAYAATSPDSSISVSAAAVSVGSVGSVSGSKGDVVPSYCGIQGMLSGYSSSSDGEMDCNTRNQKHSSNDNDNNKIINYNSSNNSSNNNSNSSSNDGRNNNADQEDKSTSGLKQQQQAAIVKKPALTRILTFTAIICKIGNRTLRLSLLPTAATTAATTAAHGKVRQFVEI